MHRTLDDGMPADDPHPEVVGLALAVWRATERHRRALSGESLEHPTRTAIAHGEAFARLVEGVYRFADVRSRLGRLTRRYRAILDLEGQYRRQGICTPGQAERIRVLAQRREQLWADLLTEMTTIRGLAWAA